MRFLQLLYTIPLRLRSLFRRSRVEQELDEELQFHIEARIAREIVAGKTPEQARRDTLLALQGIEQTKEQCRDTRRLNFADELWRNFVYALKALKANPGFTAVTVLTLALGIGANSAIFSLVDTVMLRMLPVKSPEQLYFIEHDPVRRSVSWNYADYRAMRDENTVFNGLAAYSLGMQSIGIQNTESSAAESDLAHAVFVSGNYFDMLGVSAAIGRVFNSTDDTALGASPYAVLSYSYWQSYFAGAPAIIGRKLRINGYPFTIIGISPRDFSGADIAFKPDLFLPVTMRNQILKSSVDLWHDRHMWWIAAIGRLKPAVPINAAEAELFRICKQQEQAERRSLANPAWANTADSIVLTSAAQGFSYYASQLRKPLLVLFAAVGVILMIACANAANLMLARAAAKRREIAVRLTLGASRVRVISQLLTESTLIALLGGISGIVVAFSLTRLLLRFSPQDPASSINGITAALDWRVVLFTAAICIVTGILFGLAPAWQSTTPDLASYLKENLPGSTGPRRFVLRKGLVILQVALSIPLLLGAGLFARTLGNLRHLDTGFAVNNVFIASVDPTAFGYQGQRAREFYDQLCSHVEAVPGVRAASLALITPLTGAGWDSNVSIEGYQAKNGQPSHVSFNAVGPRFFDALGTPLKLGRDFTEGDNPAVAYGLPTHITPGQQLPDPPGLHVAIINEAFVRQFFQARSPIGLHVTMTGPFHSSYDVVGVVADARYSSVRSAAEPMVFVPVWRRFADQRELVIRASLSLPQISELVRREIHHLDPVIPLQNVHMLEQDVDQSVLAERLIATLSALFGFLALLLCAVGLYGVVAQGVTSRTREIGIRIAIGATRPSVIWLVSEDVLRMIFLGVLIGIPVAFIAAKLVGNLLYGVTETDSVSILAALAILFAAACLAAIVPSRRAATIDPVVALRYE